MEKYKLAGLEALKVMAIVEFGIICVDLGQIILWFSEPYILRINRRKEDLTLARTTIISIYFCKPAIYENISLPRYIEYFLINRILNMNK